MPIPAARLHPLNAVPLDPLLEQVQPSVPSASADAAPSFVLLWVQASVRLKDNHALEYASLLAGRLGLPLVAAFALTPNYPEANSRHYQFLLEGLIDLKAGLRARGIPLHVSLGDVPEVIIRLAADACVLITDIGYTRLQRQWRTQVGAALSTLSIPAVGVESEAVVPVMVASDKQEFAARTIRPRINRQLPAFLVAVPQVRVNPVSHQFIWPEGEDPTALPSRLHPRMITLSAGRERGGEQAAVERLRAFVAHDLIGYAARRNDPSLDGGSRLSAYLHYGHLSPLTVALAVKESDAPQVDKDTLLEELIVRRELSFNYCWYQENYDQYEGLPNWARETLEAHANDPRETVYTAEELELARTHDPAWNAAQRELVLTGRMQGYMRMYWGKKILEWTASPQDAYRLTLQLNNRYEQDGRDPNSFVGVGWVFGLHDRPWARRPIFGTVRYMNFAGLKRKFAIEGYIRQWQNKAEQGV